MTESAQTRDGPAGTLKRMNRRHRTTVAAPRISPRLLQALPRLDRSDQPIAETNRRVGRLATRLGLYRPSYQQIRVHVRRIRLLRALRARRRAVIGNALLEIAYGRIAPNELIDVLTGASPTPRRWEPPPRPS